MEICSKQEILNWILVEKMIFFVFDYFARNVWQTFLRRFVGVLKMFKGFVSTL